MSQSEDAGSDLQNVSSLNLQNRDEPSHLRRLVPRAPPPQSAYNPALLAARYHSGLTFDGRCDVCFGRSCSLVSHRLYTQSRRRLLESTAQAPLPMQVNTFSSSYATDVSTWYTEEHSLETTWDYILPITSELSQIEMRKLFRNWFVIQASSFLSIPRPIEIANELLHGPFLLPALRDALLCHSILAVSATMQTSVPESDRRVLALTLFDHAMTLLRGRVAQNILQLDSSAMAAAIYLLYTNLFWADEDSLERHAMSIQTLVDARGGVENLGMCGAVATLLRWTDVMYSMRMAKKPCRYLLEEHTWKFEHDDSRHGAYWKDAAPSLPISDESIIRACQNCNRMIAFMDTSETAPAEPVSYSYLCRRVCQLFQQSSSPRARYFRSGTVEECIILTIDLLKVLIFMGGWENPDRSEVKMLCTCIVEAMRRSESLGFWQDHTDLFIWIMFVVRAAEHKSVAQEWSKQVARGALESRLGTRRSWTAESQQTLRGILISFGWSETALLNSIESICRKLYA